MYWELHDYQNFCKFGLLSWLVYTLDHALVIYRIAGNFREHKFLQITNKHAGGKILQFFFSRQVATSDHTPYNFPHGNVAHIVCFQLETIVRFPCLACRSLSLQSCMPEGGSLLRGSIHSCGELIVRRLQKISAVCSMLLKKKNTSNFCWFAGSASRRHCAQLVTKNCLEEQIIVWTNFFASWCLIVRISASRKFATIRYNLACLFLSAQKWPRKVHKKTSKVSCHS